MASGRAEADVGVHQRALRVAGLGAAGVVLAVLVPGFAVVFGPGARSAGDGDQLAAVPLVGAWLVAVPIVYLVVTPLLLRWGKVPSVVDEVLLGPCLLVAYGAVLLEPAGGLGAAVALGLVAAVVTFAATSYVLDRRTPRAARVAIALSAPAALAVWLA
ncbi:hypothetical protein GCM10022221_70190 [Actinocorallia aurea]